jgi:hypothetical protein
MTQRSGIVSPWESGRIIHEMVTSVHLGIHCPRFGMEIEEMRENMHISPLIYTVRCHGMSESAGRSNKQWKQIGKANKLVVSSFCLPSLWQTVARE